MIGRRWMITALAAVACAVAPAVAAATPTASVLSERLARDWGAPNRKLDVVVTVTREGRTISRTRMTVRRAGPDRARVDFVEPARELGKAVLVLGSKAWLRLPRAGKVIEVRSRRNPLTGGVTFEDLFVDDLSRYETTVTQERGQWVLELRKKGDPRAVWSRVFFDPKTLAPVSREVRSSSGKPIRTMTVEATTVFRGSSVPVRIRFVDRAPGRSETLMEILAVEDLEKDSAALFDRQAFGRGLVEASGDDESADGAAGDDRR